MKKKLLAVAVAGAFAVPGVALAQSSVTISGFFKGGFESLRYGQSAKANNSQSGVVDDSSRIIFNVREDLGGGLAAIGQIDMRFKLDDPSGSPAQNPVNISQGNTHVGLVSKDWGRIFIGRQDLHYHNRESNLTVRGSLRADSVSILAFAGGGATAIAGATRTQNVVHYTTPNWGGFTAILAYSSNPTAVEADIGSGVRRGRAWNFNPNMAGSNWQVGYSYWSAKNDAFAANDQRGDRLYGSYRWGGLHVGLAWDKSKLKNAAGVTTSNRNAWSLPVEYTWGNHGIYAHYSRARDDKATAARDGARMWALSYAYNFSKRTSVALTYASIRNDVGAVYNLFTSATLGLGGGAGAIAAGEDPRTWGVTVRHAF
ncbi:MAG: porin [Burkholderiales bacterium]|nr:porin [Burkholderiales bacterium]